MVVEINPKHVVSVPLDCNEQKVRVCQYTVVDELDRENFQPLSKLVYPARSEGDV